MEGAILGLVFAAFLYAKRRRKVIQVDVTNVCIECRSKLVRNDYVCSACEIEDKYACPTCGMAPSDCAADRRCLSL